MSDSRKKYEELAEEGKIKSELGDIKKNLNVECGFAYKKKQILKEYEDSQHSSESDTSMSSYFVSKFLDWLSDEYNLIKRNYKL